MRSLAILLAGSLAACASHNAPPPASSNSVQAATSTPSTGPSFAPDRTDGVATAPADTHWPRTDATAQNPPAAGNTNTDTSANGATGKSGTSNNTNATGAGSTARDRDRTSAPNNAGNAAALPDQNGSHPAYDADNSRVNARDKDGSTLTPPDQGSSDADRQMTAKIRRAVVADGSLSFKAKNVKIITLNGKVTLRGTVKSDAERTRVEQDAKQVAGNEQVENFLEVSK